MTTPTNAATSLAAQDLWSGNNYPDCYTSDADFELWLNFFADR
jgi:hypothetical protein